MLIYLWEICLTPIASTEVGNLHATKQTKAVSTLVLILLILCFTVIGALISYLWVMGSFYLEPENTTTLTITAASFPVTQADYFNFTIMNPAHSVSDANITSIYFMPKGEITLQQVNDTYPLLPIHLARGTSKNVKCFTNWGLFAGKDITIGVVASGASGATKTVATEFVGLELETYFDPAVSSKQFRISVRNAANSTLNILELTKVTMNGMSIQNTSTALPVNLTAGIPSTFYCNYDWQGLVEETVRVETKQGYYAEKKANGTAVLLLAVDDVEFNETYSNRLNIKITNSQVSKTSVDVNNITLTYGNGTKINLDGNLSTPKFAPSYRLDVNRTVTFKDCQWDWRNYRNQNVTLTVYTKQNYTAVSKLRQTPVSVAFNVVPTFNLSNTNSFLVNVTNSPTSLFDINVTEIKLHLNQTGITPQVVTPSHWVQFNCVYNWTGWRGISRMVYVNASYGSPVVRLIKGEALILPSIHWIITGQANATDKNTFNMTVQSHANSLNATLARIVVTYGNQTVFQSQGIGYLIQGNQTVTLTFSWNWTLYTTKMVKIAIYTTQDMEFDSTFTFP
jgi:hypothetical protein